jgi:DNA-directed RNA polymerase subunit K/omega
MIQKPEEFDSVFRYIVVVSQRAEQLITGAKPRGESRHVKPTLIARDDVDQGRVEWRILTQEELDAQRQALVEQFRAEVGGEAAAEPARRIPDVLPTSVPFSGLDDEEAYEGDEDDELDRLQRLLGMARESRGGEAKSPGSRTVDEAIGADSAELGDGDEGDEDEVEDIDPIDDFDGDDEGDEDEQESEDEIPLDDEPDDFDADDD